VKQEEEGTELGISISEVHADRLGAAQPFFCERQCHPIAFLPGGHQQPATSDRSTSADSEQKPPTSWGVPAVPSAFSHRPAPCAARRLHPRSRRPGRRSPRHGCPSGLGAGAHLPAVPSRPGASILTSGEKRHLPELWDKRLPNRTQRRVHLLGFLYLYFFSSRITH